jgi:hypothetical protein
MKLKLKFFIKVLYWAILITVFTLNSSCITIEPPRGVAVHTYHTHVVGPRYVSQYRLYTYYGGNYHHVNTRVCPKCGSQYRSNTRHVCRSETHIYIGEAVFRRCPLCGCVYPAHYTRCRNCISHHRHQW